MSARRFGNRRETPYSRLRDDLLHRATFHGHQSAKLLTDVELAARDLRSRLEAGERVSWGDLLQKIEALRQHAAPLETVKDILRDHVEESA